MGSPSAYSFINCEMGKREGERARGGERSKGGGGGERESKEGGGKNVQTREIKFEGMHIYIMSLECNLPQICGGLVQIT